MLQHLSFVSLNRTVHYGSYRGIAYPLAILRPYKAVSPPRLGLRHRAPAAQHGELIGGDDRAQVVAAVAGVDDEPVGRA